MQELHEILRVPYWENVLSSIAILFSQQNWTLVTIIILQKKNMKKNKIKIQSSLLWQKEGHLS